MNRNGSYEFGPYCVNVSERVLLRSGKPVSLTPKAFDILLVLVRNSGHLVEKDQLMTQVWPETAVEEANLTQNIFTLRRILGDTAEEPTYIETVPRRGYRFIASVKELAGSTSRSVTTSGRDPRQSSVSQLRRLSRYLAVLPFVDASADANLEYLADGITESIINSLAQLPMLRVKSRSAVFRYKSRELDAQQIGRELGVDAVLVGRVYSQDGRMLISAELVEVANGWQLWGDNYDRGPGAIFEVQDEIAKQISAALRLKLTGEEENSLTKRYTKSAEAYQSYLKGRFLWSKYTREGLEEAIDHFRRAIDLDQNYALAYAGIVDCYLRLATNYIPPADAAPQTGTRRQTLEVDGTLLDAQASLGMVKMRYEWDRTAAEREIKRAAELKSSYPAAHQWYAAYTFSAALYDKALKEGEAGLERDSTVDHCPGLFDSKLPDGFQSANPTRAEEVQVFCTIAREQIEAGNYEAGCAVLQRWWTMGEWPKLEGLEPNSSADLLFTAGVLAGWVASTRQVPRGQKHAEALLNGAVALFEQLGLKTRSAEGQIELAYCYYREGLFDLGRLTLLAALEVLSDDQLELKCLGLIRFASLERHAGRLKDAVERLNKAAEMVELVGPWANGRYHLELATTLKNLATSDTLNEYSDQAIAHYRQALFEFDAIGNHRHAAIVENNHGYLLLTLEQLNEAEIHLVRARTLFEAFGDKVKRAQVDETLARLHLARERFDLAEEVIVRAVQSMEGGAEELLLAEALTTYGLVLCRLSRHREAKRVLDRANQLAESCGDKEGAGRALLIVIEEMCTELDEDERLELAMRLERLLGQSQQASILERLRACRQLILEASRVARDSRIRLV